MTSHFLIFARRVSHMLSGATLALALGLTPALSLDSGWAETEGGRMRLVVDPAPRADGTITGVLEIDLDPGWKTYWRDPGGAGIPPMLDVSQSKGISLEKMQYPPPVRIDDGYAIWAGYTASVKFPLTFERTAAGSASIHALVFVGICEKICVPFQAEFEIDLPEGTGTDDAARASIREAFDRLPEPAGADFNVEQAALAADGGQLEISARLPQFRPSGVTPDVFVAGPTGFAFAQPKLVAEVGGSIRWSVDIASVPATAAPEQSETLDIVVTLGQRAISQSVPVKGFSRE
ncbi:MAG: hypothetical protein KUA43_12065 [Hoeflea sp.]|uniref:protein-disulfide reductase DsbD domain-containing protein n=1 Tax=Hoeflea sp. TaxID=1940281 RepID=UPI001DAA795E|nr:protein-disulfide reductase DsbD domain-containing protein [Hoeflea sp.]MBU4527748.1 hypothetical protein [Alphaproteobacteria bacterium]MBU4546217.1 hypothetical protein [Alphaproteobacteria bacterium]MBU4553098.1 hypothetical protein [Alphaproteobacteria bacterium]MBV1724170.1 hypothetical protein [Hoeflea sp.]MBV1759855.1 hypothetical protein [Hoeflea sp.]